jgi:hypothetical protein
VGFFLEIREPRWHEHRCLVATAPRANLHVWGPDSVEAIRHPMFRDWLREHAEDRGRYAAAKRVSTNASNAAAEDVMAYNLRKQAGRAGDPGPHVSGSRRAVTRSTTILSKPPCIAMGTVLTN